MISVIDDFRMKGRKTLSRSSQRRLSEKRIRIRQDKFLDGRHAKEHPNNLRKV